MINDPQYLLTLAWLQWLLDHAWAPCAVLLAVFLAMVVFGWHSQLNQPDDNEEDFD